METNFSKYAETWDPQIVLNHLKGYPDIKEMTLKQLTLKMTMIMVLVAAQRTQTLKLLSILKTCKLTRANIPFESHNF